MDATSHSPAGLSALLAELASAPAADRALLLRQRGTPEEILDRLISHVESIMLADLPAALKAADVVVQASDAAEAPAARVRSRRIKAQCLSYANRFSEALAIFDEAAAIAQQLGNKREAALVNMTRMHALARLGRLDEAVEAGEAAHRDLLACGEQMTAAKADVNLGVVERMRDQPAKALSRFDRARPSFVDQPTVIAQIDSNRAEALLDLHDFEGAETAFRAALQTFETAGAHRAASIVEGNLADLMGRQGRLGSALHHFEQARRRIEKDAAPGDAARLAGEAAEVQLELGLIDEAARASADAARVLQQQGMIAEAARVRITLGRALAATGMTQEAERELLAAASEFESARQPQRAARAILARAELLTLGNGGSRVGVARPLVLSVLPQLGDRPADAALAHAILAAIELRSGNENEAISHTDDGLALAEPLGLGPLIGQLLHLRGRALLQLGNVDEAVEVFERAVDEIERIRGSLQADRFRTAFHARRASVYGDAVAAVLKTAETDRIARAFSLVERSRSRALLDLLTRSFEPPIAPDLDRPEAAEMSAELARWRARLNALYTSLHEAGGAQRSSVPKWQEQIGEAEQQIARLESRLASVSRLDGLFGRAVSLAEALQHIPQDTALLEYFIAGDRILAFILGQGQQPAVHDLCAVSDIAGHLTRLRFHIAGAIARGSAGLPSQSSANVDCELRELHRLLMEPILEHLKDKQRLIIAPYGPLHAVPFHALRDLHQYIIERFEVTYVPSASVLVQLSRQMPGGSTGTPLLVAYADEQAPAIDEEVQTLARLLPGARLLRDEEATVAAVIERAADSPLVHIAAHGIFSSPAPHSSGVRLVDGWLSAREAIQMRLDGATVVLSGCETGRSAITEADELLGLIRGLLAAGARSVLASLWSVHDETATELLVSTYRMWYLNPAGAPGRSLAAALRQAQQDLLRREIHPAYWAPFFLVGKP